MVGNLVLKHTLQSGIAGGVAIHGGGGGWISLKVNKRGYCNERRKNFRGECLWGGLLSMRLKANICIK